MKNLVYNLEPSVSRQQFLKELGDRRECEVIQTEKEKHGILTHKWILNITHTKKMRLLAPELVVHSSGEAR